MLLFPNRRAHVSSALAGHCRTAGVALVLLAAFGYVVVPQPAAARSPRPRMLPEVPVTSIDFRDERANNSASLATDPTDEQFVAMASRVDAPDFDCRLHVSGDGGSSWVPARPVPKLPRGAEKCYAPEVAFNADGTLYYLFVGLKGLGNVPMGAFLTTSSDRGRTFTPPRRLLGGKRYMVRMAMDSRRGEEGRLHLVWLEARSATSVGGLGAPPNPIMAAYSDDGGQSFSNPVQVSPARRLRVVAPALAVDGRGGVHVAYYDLGKDVVDYQGLEGDTWDGKWSLVLSSSTDGGRQFDKHSVIDRDVVPPERVMLIFTMAPPSLAVDGRRLYVSWWDARSGDWDVFLRSSSDGGESWRKPMRLNDDAPANGRHQYLPRLSVAPNGRIDAIFYDRRRDGENVRNDVYYTSSSDACRSFGPNVLITTTNFDSRIGARYPIQSANGLVEFGSRLGLTSTSSAVVAAWTDTRNSVSDHYHQDLVARSLEFADPQSRTPRAVWPSVVLAGVLCGPALVWARKRRRRRRQVPSPDTHSQGWLG